MNRSAASQSGSSPGSSATSSTERPSSAARERRRGALDELVVALPGQRVLELVVRQRRLCLLEVALRQEVEVRLAARVERQLLVDDLPADRAPGRFGRERVAEAGRARSEAPERPDVLTPVRIPQPKPVARGLRPRAVALDPLDEPVAPLEPDHVARLERLLRRVGVYVLLASAVHDRDFVCAHQWNRGRTSSKSSSSTGTKPERR